MAGVLEEAGYTCAAEAGDADVIIYNTCSIRDKAEQKVYSALGKQAPPAPPRRPPCPLHLSLCARLVRTARGLGLAAGRVRVAPRHCASWHAPARSSHSPIRRCAAACGAPSVPAIPPGLSGRARGPAGVVTRVVQTPTPRGCTARAGQAQAAAHGQPEAGRRGLRGGAGGRRAAAARARAGPGHGAAPRRPVRHQDRVVGLPLLAPRACWYGNSTSAVSHVALHRVSCLPVLLVALVRVVSVPTLRSARPPSAAAVSPALAQHSLTARASVGGPASAAAAWRSRRPLPVPWRTPPPRVPAALHPAAPESSGGKAARDSRSAPCSAGRDSSGSEGATGAAGARAGSGDGAAARAIVMRPVAHGSSASRQGRARRVCRVSNARRIGELLEQVDLGAQVVAVEPVDIPEDIAVPRRDSALSAWVNVIHGCNERCTYCVVPNTRGAEQSRAPDAIRARRAGFAVAVAGTAPGGRRAPPVCRARWASHGTCHRAGRSAPIALLRRTCKSQRTATHAFRVISDPAAARPAGLVSQRG